jgi:hypothetical protein
MHHNTFGIITPSYAPDFERCRLLCKSIQAFVKPPYRHYLVVDRADMRLFRELASPMTEIVIVEDVLPKWIRRSPLSDKVWLSLKTLPIRNWLLQQIVKLEMAQSISEEVAVFVDSDVVFVRPFDLQSFSHADKPRIYRNIGGSPLQKRVHYKWHKSAAKLLGLKAINPAIPDYIGNIITWQRRDVISLCRYVEKLTGRYWLEVIGNTWCFSEYILYGTYIDQVLQDSACCYHDELAPSLDYWAAEPLNSSQLQSFLGEIRPDQVAVMISAKAKMPVEQYAPLLEKMFGGWALADIAPTANRR